MGMTILSVGVFVAMILSFIVLWLIWHFWFAGHEDGE